MFVLAVSDTVAAAWIAAGGGVIAGFIAALSAYMSHRARRDVRGVRQSVGESNGMGTVVHMLETLLKGQGALQTQVQTVKQDVEVVQNDMSDMKVQVQDVEDRVETRLILVENELGEFRFRLERLEDRRN